MRKQDYVYIMANSVNTVFYTGVTSNLIRRARQRKNKLVEGFTKRYNLIKLVYYEIFDVIEDAIISEKHIILDFKIYQIYYNARLLRNISQ